MFFFSHEVMKPNPPPHSSSKEEAICWVKNKPQDSKQLFIQILMLSFKNNNTFPNLGNFQECYPPKKRKYIAKYSFPHNRMYNVLSNTQPLSKKKSSLANPLNVVYLGKMWHLWAAKLCWKKSYECDSECQGTHNLVLCHAAT